MHVFLELRRGQFATQEVVDHQRQSLRIIKELLKSSPKQSLRTLAGEINCGKDSVRKIIVEELELRSVLYLDTTRAITGQQGQP